MSESPSGRFNLADRARRNNLTMTPKFTRAITESKSAKTLPSHDTPKTPITCGPLDLRARASENGLMQKWDGLDRNPMQANKHGGNIDNEYTDTSHVLGRGIVEDRAKPRNIENQESVFGDAKSPRKKTYQTKTNADTRSYSSNSSDIPTSVLIGTRKLDLKNYNLLDIEDWSRLGKGSRIAYEKKDGKVVEGHVVHALYSNKKDPTDEREYMLMEAYNFKQGKKSMFKWSITYDDIKHLWVHPGQSCILEKEQDLRTKFESSIDTKRTVRTPVSSQSSIDNAILGKLKNNVETVSINLNDLIRSHDDLTRKNEKLEEDIDNIMSFLTRKFSNQFQPTGYFPSAYLGTQDNNMRSQVL